MILFGKFCVCRLQGKPITKTDLQELEKRIMLKLSELAPALETVVTALDGVSASLALVGPQLEKAKNEIISSLSDVEIPADAAQKIAALSTIAAALQGTSSQIKLASQTLDDLNADAPETPAQ